MTETNLDRATPAHDPLVDRAVRLLEFLGRSQQLTEPSLTAEGVPRQPGNQRRSSQREGPSGAFRLPAERPAAVAVTGSPHLTSARDGWPGRAPIAAGTLGRAAHRLPQLLGGHRVPTRASCPQHRLSRLRSFPLTRSVSAECKVLTCRI